MKTSKLREHVDMVDDYLDCAYGHASANGIFSLRRGSVCESEMNQVRYLIDEAMQCLERIRKASEGREYAP